MRIAMNNKYIFLFISLFILTGCNRVNAGDPLVERQYDNSNTSEILSDADNSGIASSNVRNVRVRDDTEYQVYPSIPFDGIRPVYKPEFASSAEAPLLDDELVIGVAWGGEAKAYPITILRFREMVNDQLAGIPTLVTW